VRQGRKEKKRKKVVTLQYPKEEKKGRQKGWRAKEKGVGAIVLSSRKEKVIGVRGHKPTKEERGGKG